jgi:hypothetical protein
MAILTTEYDTGKKYSMVADFSLMTITTISSGGYGAGSVKKTAITAAGAEAFWSGFAKITPLRSGDRHQVGGNSWNAKVFDGEKIWNADGIIHDDAYIGTAPDSGSYPELVSLFDLLT